jgi:hypothetical protein
LAPGFTLEFSLQALFARAILGREKEEIADFWSGAPARSASVAGRSFQVSEIMVAAALTQG